LAELGTNQYVVPQGNGNPPQPNPSGGFDAPNLQGQAPQHQPQQPPPPTEQLITPKVEIETTGLGIKRFLVSLSIVIIVGSLFVYYLQTAKGSAANQAEAKYKAGVGATLDSPQFVNQEKAVQQVGSQVAYLQSALAQRTLFSRFFTELNKITYQHVRLTKVVVNNQGQVSIEGVAPSFYDLAKETDALKGSAQYAQVELMAAEKQPDGQVLFTMAAKLNKSALSASQATK